jgi:tRNA1Val (adenine37-N6)-methyltransferase
MTTGLVREDESLDDLGIGGLKIIQKRQGYRFSLDPVLLCDFARIDGALSIVDLGTGAGVIPILLARRNVVAQLIGVEIQPDLADCARRSLLLNGLQDRVTILEQDLRAVRGVLAPQSSEAVLSNPPYRRPDQGRIAPRAERAAARHELAGGLDDFLAAAAYLLKQGGALFIIYLAERLAELLAAMRSQRLEPKRLRTVHSHMGEEAKLVLVEGRHRGSPGLRVEAPLYIYEGDRYSAEIMDIYRRQE